MDVPLSGAVPWPLMRTGTRSPGSIRSQPAGEKLAGLPSLPRAPTEIVSGYRAGHWMPAAASLPAPQTINAPVARRVLTARRRRGSPRGTASEILTIAGDSAAAAKSAFARSQGEPRPDCGTALKKTSCASGARWRMTSATLVAWPLRSRGSGSPPTNDLPASPFGAPVSMTMTLTVFGIIFIAFSP